ncbi:RNA 2',3'-cyclic phosphodiesterase [Bacillus tianshenii]|nr:RNA 2',3'-cyclic phosphodiesterase [Bacillus tianshenii]
MKTHYFLAVPLAQEVKDKLALQMNDWKERLDFKKWVHPQDLHITLVFLGDATKEQIQLINEKMPALMKDHQPFELQLSSVGSFGRGDSPRIFWAGVKESKALNNLQKDIAALCGELGFQLDRRGFTPHITLARKWVSNDTFLSEKSELEIGGLWNVDEVVLYQTHLHQSPKYEAINVFVI